MKKLIFYNNWHNGDIHYTREFVKDIIKKTSFDEYYYLHNCPSKLVMDIGAIYGIPDENCLDYNIHLRHNDDTYINTWIGAIGSISDNLEPRGLKSIYIYFRNIFDRLFIKMENIEYYIPTIDFKKYDISRIDDYVSNNSNLKVLVSNGLFYSKQSYGVDFNYIIDKLSIKYPKIDFIFTDSSNRITDRENIKYTDDIINTSDGDLNEISYLSTFCDTIIGRSSGPYSFSHIKENLNDINKSYIFMGYHFLDGILYDRAKSDKIWIDIFDDNYILKVIDQEFSNKKFISLDDLIFRKEDDKIYIKSKYKLTLSVDIYLLDEFKFALGEREYNPDFDIWVVPFQTYKQDVHPITMKFYTGNKRFLFQTTI